MSRTDARGARLERRLAEIEGRAAQLGPAVDRDSLNLLLNDCAAEALHARLAGARKRRRRAALLGAGSGSGDALEARRLEVEIERLETVWTRLSSLIQELRARPRAPGPD